MSFYSTEGEHSNKKIFYPEHLLELPAEQQTILHCFAPGDQKIGISSSSVLICRDMGERSKLLFSFGIPLYPKYSEGTNQCFTLVFEALPTECELFHFSEKPDEAGGFHLSCITRTPDDIYWLPFILDTKGLF